MRMERGEKQEIHSNYLTHGTLFHSAYDSGGMKLLTHSRSSHTLETPSLELPSNLHNQTKYKSTSVGNLSDNVSKDGARVRKGKSKALHFWNSDDVNKWLRKHCVSLYPLYGNLMKEHDINGRSLVRLTEWKLEMIGITQEQHREELMRQIMRLKLKSDAQELKSLEGKALTYERKGKPQPK